MEGSQGASSQRRLPSQSMSCLGFLDIIENVNQTHWTNQKKVVRWILEGASMDRSQGLEPAEYTEEVLFKLFGVIRWLRFKIIMPEGALHRLADLSIPYPMLFELQNPKMRKKMHCGVLEFSAEEGFVYLPYWMMENLFLEEGDLVRLTSVALPLGTHLKIQPQSPDFLEINNPRAVNLSALSVGDMLPLYYNNRKYSLAISELRPADAVSIVETDLNVEFAPVPGMSDAGSAPPPSPRVASKGGLTFKSRSEQKIDIPNGPEPGTQRAPEPTEPTVKWTPFGGAGQRLDGKPISSGGAFSQRASQKPAKQSVEKKESFKSFSGEGMRL